MGTFTIEEEKESGVKHFFCEFKYLGKELLNGPHTFTNHNSKFNAYISSIVMMPIVARFLSEILRASKNRVDPLVSHSFNCDPIPSSILPTAQADLLSLFVPLRSTPVPVARPAADHRRLTDPTPAMSLFTQQSNALDALIADWNANLAADADEQIELLHDLQQQESE
jgi:hypothetical protein